MNSELLNYYEAIEQASADMLTAARTGNWDEVVKLEGACVLLISQLKAAANHSQLAAGESHRALRVDVVERAGEGHDADLHGRVLTPRRGR